MFRIIFLGDIMGRIGREALRLTLPSLRAEYAADLVIANIENASHGTGVTPAALQELSDAGIDAFTGGNHSWDNPSGTAVYDTSPWSARLVRPANTRRGDPGRGSIVLKTPSGVRVLLINLMGMHAMPGSATVERPFEAADTLIASHQADKPDIIFLDIHAELTAEKEALGHYVDGRVSAIIGTHTHVQTSDARILPGGTAYCTDAGRTGAYDSVLGFKKQSSIKRFLNLEQDSDNIPEFGLAEIDGVFIEVDERSGKALRIDTFRKLVEVLAKKR
ncbi:MAG: YmdB family metallophosphoesterase [Candidatus Uhrbacteria bacterium]|nr:YmdB family metallophosphoesterase [Candidatus Uhrbacteria bacterium]